MSDPTSVEQQLMRAGGIPHLMGGPETDPARVDENLLLIHAELDAPAESRLARTLRRFGVRDLSVPLVTATPALRRSWFIAVISALLFGLGSADETALAGPDDIVTFLTVAPLVPLLGIALAFGKGVDPTHDIVIAAPRDTFVVFLVRALTVLTASTVLLLPASLLLPHGGLWRVAWLLPSLALTAATMAMTSRFEARRVALATAATWVAIVITVVNLTSANAFFGLTTQVLAAIVTVGAAAFVYMRRAAFDRATQ